MSLKLEEQGVFFRPRATGLAVFVGGGHENRVEQLDAFCTESVSKRNALKCRRTYPDTLIHDLDNRLCCCPYIGEVDDCDTGRNYGSQTDCHCISAKDEYRSRMKER